MKCLRADQTSSFQNSLSAGGKMKNKYAGYFQFLVFPSEWLPQGVLMSPTLSGSQSQCSWDATGEATSHTPWILLSPETDRKSPANVGVIGSDWGPSSRTAPTSADHSEGQPCAQGGRDRPRIKRLVVITWCLAHGRRRGKAKRSWGQAETGSSTDEIDVKDFHQF